MACKALWADDISWLLRLVSKYGVIYYLWKNMKTYTCIFSVILLVSATQPLLQPKATQCGILTVRSKHNTSSARSGLRAIQDGGRGNFKWNIGLMFGRRLKKKFLDETFFYSRSSNKNIWNILGDACKNIASSLYTFINWMTYTFCFHYICTHC